MKLRIDRITNQRGATATLLRTSWREGKRVRHKTVANLALMEPEIVDGLEILLNGGVAFDPAKGHKGISILRALPHGHAAAALGTARAVGLERILHRSPGRERDLALAATVARITAPDSKLATARRLSPETADSSLGAMLGLGTVCGNEMLAMLDWLRRRQPWIERSLANRHLGDGTLILYDVTSSYLEGRCCPLAAFGHSRDGKRGKLQITFGLLCAADGCPVAVEVFPGNASDPSTVASQVAKLRTRFGIGRIAMVGDRGMITTARIRQDLEPAGLDWISALRNADIRRLLRPSHGDAPLRPGEPAADAVAEIASPDFPGERLMVCLNPRLRQERRRKREELLQATETELRSIADAAARRRPGQANRDRTGRAIGARGNKRKVLKHFDITLGMETVTFRRNDAGSPPRRRSTGYAWSGPAFRPVPSVPRVRWRHTRPSQGWSGHSAARSPTSGSARSMCARRSMCGATCSCACLPITSSGTCAGGWRRSCSRTTTARVPGRSGRPLLPRPRCRPAPS